jgi:hypothetical protein
MEKTRAIEAIIPVGEASPVGYRNVYEDGDEWVKVHGCDGCERPAGSCCGNCPHLVEHRCALHIRDGMSLKPLYCIVKPVPTQCLKGCRLVFRCVAGSLIGKERHLTDTGGVFRGPES